MYIIITNECRSRSLNDLRCIQRGTCKTTYGTRNEVVHELRLWALPEIIKFRSSSGVKKPQNGHQVLEVTIWLDECSRNIHRSSIPVWSDIKERWQVELNLNQCTYLQNVDSIPAYNPRGPSFRITCFSTSIGPLNVLVLSWSLDSIWLLEWKLSI